MREFDLRQPVCEYLIDRDYFPAVEFWLHGSGITDIVAGSYEPRVGRKIPKLRRVVAIELKLSRVGEVMSQAIQNAHKSHFSYAAMPVDNVDRMRQSTIERFEQNGIGLLAVGERIQEVVRARFNRTGLNPNSREAAQLWRRVRQDFNRKFSVDSKVK